MGEFDLSIGEPEAPQVSFSPDDPGVFDDELGELDDAPMVDEHTVRLVLIGLGSGANNIFADEDLADQWKFTPSELDGVVPPLTRIINRRPALRRAIAKGDYALVALHLGGYVGRNVGAGHRVARNRDGNVNTEIGGGLGAGQAFGGAPGGASAWDDGPGDGDRGARFP